MRRLLIVIAVLVAALLGGLTTFDYLAPEKAAEFGVGLERSRNGLAEKRITVDGLDIAYLEGGPADGEPLILVHGFGADKDNFTRVSGLLTPHYRVIVPDLPGFGESSKPMDADYTIDAQAGRVHAFAQALGVKRAHLGGSSMGGAIVTAYALKYPGETASLWLLGPAGLSKALDSELGRTIRETGRNPLLAQTPEEFPAIMDFVMSRPPFFPHSLKLVLGRRAAADYPLHQRIFAQLNDPKQPLPNLDGLIRNIQAPALVVWGNEDRALNHEAAQVYKAEMPKAEIIIREGIGHLPMIEEPRQSARDYLAFRASLH
jgi:pimeloyl-ACP methyl ester carboxylesterase